VFTNLSLQQNPPFSVPARFFITAPLFDIGAALIFLFYGSGMLVSRWSPGMLAATHALVLGFFATVMLGALQQILPVVVGVSICHPKRVASIVHLLWVIGITLLIGAFLWPANNLFYIAVIVLGSAIVIFVGTILMSLQRAPTHSESTPGIKLAVSSLFITLVLGVVLIFGHTGVIPLFRPGLTNLHMKRFAFLLRRKTPFQSPCRFSQSMNAFTTYYATHAASEIPSLHRDRPEDREMHRTIWQ